MVDAIAEAEGISLSSVSFKALLGKGSLASNLLSTSNLHHLTWRILLVKDALLRCCFQGLCCAQFPTYVILSSFSNQQFMLSLFSFYIWSTCSGLKYCVICCNVVTQKKTATELQFIQRIILGLAQHARQLAAVNSHVYSLRVLENFSFKNNHLYVE